MESVEGRRNRMNNALQWMKEELAQLDAKAQYRSLASAAALADGWINKDGRRMLNLASNHYLGLDLDLDEARLERLACEAEAFGSKVRLGSTASRLIVGSDPVFAGFEAEFARFKGTESCLLFGSGYMANVGVIPTLVGRHDIVFSDRLNHASLIDGIALSRAELMRYKHRDLDQLEHQLKRTGPGKKKLIVTDTIFSMDGSLAPLRELVKLKHRYGAMLMVDEAHSGGVYGEFGEGLTHDLGLTEQVDIQMGTFSKAYGCYGAYIAGTDVVKQYLINKARSFIYTTALPPLIILAIRDNWLKAKAESWRRQVLRESSARFRAALQSIGLNTGESESQVIPVIIGDNERTVAFSQRLQEAGIAAVAIRPPTVPQGTSRIRFTLMATHQQTDLEWALEHIAIAANELGLV
jgi:8-amino-7-oxononanoate synthase